MNYGGIPKYKNELCEKESILLGYIKIVKKEL